MMIGGQSTTIHTSTLLLVLQTNHTCTSKEAVLTTYLIYISIEKGDHQEGAKIISIFAAVPRAATQDNLCGSSPCRTLVLVVCM